MKEKRSLLMVSLLFAIIAFLLDLFINYRLFHQTVNDPGIGVLLGDYLKPLFILAVTVGSVFGAGCALYVIKCYTALLLAYYFLHGRLGENEMPATKGDVLFAFTSTLIFIASGYFSSYAFIVRESQGTALPFTYYLLTNTLAFTGIIYSYSRIGKTVASKFSASMLSEVHGDPFGRRDRVFHQQTRKLENPHSINIPYNFTDIDFKIKKGWINFVNIFRAVMVLGVPGSGKSFAFFLPAIQQMVQKGFTLVIYDFKFDDLSRYTYNCLLDSSEYLLKKNGLLPQFAIISLEKTLYSERCNVFQPQLLQDFTVDAYGLAKAFMVALNPSWKNKEGDFFPESATNLVAAVAWGLKIYRNGKFCTLPHLIEFLSQDTDSVVTMLISLKDNSLRNVIRPFEEAKQDGAMEQLQGQMGTVRIALSRLTSPKLYFMLTEDDDSLEPFNLQVNAKASPKLLCLANSGQNQGVNNVVLSLFVVQIFRFINKKGQHPCGIILDEAVTLSYPKGTLDTLIATGRSNLVSVWIGFQDLSQMVRDMGKDVAEAIFKMIGNTVAGVVNDDTAERMSKRIGKMKILKKSNSISAEGDLSSSYQEQFDTAVPESFISSMSQGTFVGTLADNFDQKMDLKAFYGEVDFKHPFADREMKPLPYSKYWQKVINTECKGFSEQEIEEYAERVMDMNFQRVVRDIQQMKEELMAVAR